MARFVKSLKNLANYLEQELSPDVGESVRELTTITIVTLTLPATGANDLAKFQWKESWKAAKKWITNMKKEMKWVYAVVYDQCTPRLKTRLKGTTIFVLKSKPTGTL